MEMIRLNLSVVVVAESHNPSILHPSFLTSQKIVPPEWDLAEPPICTPPFSVIKYRNGIVFSVEQNKFQILQSPVTDDWRETRIHKLAKKYIKKLPHVRYTAVGLNTAVALPHQRAGWFLAERFFKIDKCTGGRLKPESAAFKLVYPLRRSATLNVGCDPGRVKDGEGGEKEAIIVQANYHHELTASDNYGRVEQASRILSKFVDRCEHFYNDVLEVLFQDV